MTQHTRRFVCGSSQQDVAVSAEDVDARGWWTCGQCGSVMRVTIQRQHMARRIWVPMHWFLGVGVDDAVVEPSEEENWARWTAGLSVHTMESAVQAARPAGAVQRSPSTRNQTPHP